MHVELKVSAWNICPPRWFVLVLIWLIIVAFTPLTMIQLVLASFPPANAPNTPAHLPLVMKTFQSLFPPLAPGKISLSSARRVVLVSYNAERATIDVRHYLISVRAAGVSRRVRKILEAGGTSTRLSSVVSSSKGLSLGNVKDVADYVLGTRGDGDDGYETAGSTSAASEGEENSVQLAGDYTGRNNRRGEKRAVRLDEIGPRLELRLVKVTEGVPGKDGAVLYHEFGTYLTPHPFKTLMWTLSWFQYDSEEGLCGGGCLEEGRR